jgi:hypothetical protein
MKISTGTRLESAAGTAQVIVLKQPTCEVDLTCCGYPMVLVGTRTTPAADRPTFAGTLADVTIQTGKRYTDRETGLEVLVVGPGSGPLAVGDRELELMQPKKLPSSD